MSNVVSIRLSDEVYTQITASSKATGCSKSQLIQELIDVSLGISKIVYKLQGNTLPTISNNIYTYNEDLYTPSVSTTPQDIWSIWVSIAGEKNRHVLGKAIKNHSEVEVAKAIGVLLWKKPADPVSYLHGVLNGKKRKRAYVA
tara:strand:- start:191 stop:619 length:429 start_codon:yes stop_codon:yes gene_type:complete